MEREKSNDPAEKQPASSSRSIEINDSIIESPRSGLRLDGPHPDSELSYSQQIKEQEKAVSTASKSLEPNDQVASKSLEADKPNELAVSKQTREDETEAKEKRNLLKKLTASLAQSAYRPPTRLSALGGKRRNMARYKRRRSLSGPSKRQAARRKPDRSTTPDSDDELSNNPADFSSLPKRREARTSELQRGGRDCAFKVFGEPKNKKRKLTDLDELVNRALIKHNTFKFNDCNISLHFT